MTTDILIEHDDAVWTILFNRPHKRNALTHAMYTALVDTLAAAAADPSVRVVILSGVGDCFTAGNDLQDFLHTPPTTPESPVVRFLRALVDFPKPLLAAIPGAAIGIGTTLLMHCELAWASPKARFQLPFAQLALVPEGAASYLLPLAVGAKQANAMLLAGEALDAEAAAKAGLINAVIPADALQQHVREQARRLADLPPDALRQTKALLRAPHRAATETALFAEIQAFGRQLQSAECRAALQAFFQRPASAAATRRDATPSTPRHQETDRS